MKKLRNGEEPVQGTKIEAVGRFKLFRMRQNSRGKPWGTINSDCIHFYVGKTAQSSVQGQKRPKSRFLLAQIMKKPSVNVFRLLRECLRAFN